MNKEDFNALVDLAMRDANLSTMHSAVEKELLYYEIFQALDAARETLKKSASGMQRKAHGAQRLKPIK